MDLNKKLLTLLAIFCLIASAGVVCAADYDDGYAGINYEDMNGVSGSQYDDTNDTVLEPGAGLPLENQTNPMAGNDTNNATGNTTGNITGNATAHAAGGIAGNTTTNATAHNTMFATGNPILALFAVCAVLCGAAIIRKQ